MLAILEIDNSKYQLSGGLDNPRKGILIDGQPLTLWPEAILTAVVGLGLAFVVWQRRVKPGASLASNP